MRSEAIKILRFFVCGGTSTLIDFILYFLLSILLDVSLAKFISMTVSCIVSFFLNKRWTFQIRQKPALGQVFKFIAAQILNISANVLSNAWFYNIIHKKIPAYLFATALGTTINFLLQRFFVFKK